MMNEKKTNPVFDAIRKTLPLNLLFWPVNAAFATPANPGMMSRLSGTPEGLCVLHTAASVPEAEMLTQVLIEAGFHIEYVPPVTGGLFGILGNNVIYVAQSEYEQAAEFLRDYLNPA